MTLRIRTILMFFLILFFISMIGCSVESNESSDQSCNKIHKVSILSNSERVNYILKQFGEDLILWAFQEERKMKSRMKTKISVENNLQHPDELFLSFLLNMKDDKSMPDTLIKLSGRGLFLTVQINADTNTQPACFFTQYEGAQVKIPHDLLQRDKPNVIYITYERDRYLTLFVNGQLVEFTPVHGSMPSGSPRITIGSYILSCSDSLKLPSSISELVIGTRIPDFEQRFHFHRLWEAEYGLLDFDIYPVYQYYNMIMVNKNLIMRDPSEILHINGRFWVYFTGVKAPLRDGFKGSVYTASCADTDDPSKPENWGEPIEVIQKGNPQTDHDGTGCFTPDCYYDGSNIFVFYTGLNSTHPRGFPQWGPVKEPEHIMVAKSTRPEGGFQKPPKHTPLAPETRALNYNEATIPGGYKYLNSEPLYDVSLIDHGQCWVMDDGERRYYYKGGGGGDYSVASHKGKHGAVCLMRGFDENWLNGYRHSTAPVIYENSHMEGILITRVQDQLFLQTMVFGPPRVWVTYTSPADDGINWKFIDGHHLPKPDCTYPLSIGVYPTINPEWGIGQFSIEGRYIGLAYLRIL